MNTGQMLLTTGAMVLLGTTVVTVSQNHLQQGTILRQTELGIYAVSLATSYIEKASGMDFDEKSVAGLPTISLGPASVLTESAFLGIDNPHVDHVNPINETSGVDSTFDDFDDFNKLDITDVVANVDAFQVQATVFYVGPNAPYSKTTERQWLKQMDIKVASTVNRRVFEKFASDTNNTGVDTIKLSYIFSYFR